MQVPRGPLRGAAAGGGGSLTLGKQPAIPGLEEQGLPGVEPVRSRLGLGPAQPPHHTLPLLCGGLGSLEPVNTGDKVPASPVLASRKPAAGRHRGDLSLSGPGSAPVKILLHLGL